MKQDESKTLHPVMFWKVGHFTTIAVRASHPTVQHEAGSKQNSTYRNVLEGWTPHNHRCESLTSCSLFRSLAVILIWRKYRSIILYFWIIVSSDILICIEARLWAGQLRNRCWISSKARGFLFSTRSRSTQPSCLMSTGGKVGEVWS
jgi:hypothetical protein